MNDLYDNPKVLKAIVKRKRPQLQALRKRYKLNPLARAKKIRVGARVFIARCDIFAMHNRTNWNGRITKIDGGYYYVRPMWAPRDMVLELYDNEFEPL